MGYLVISVDWISSLNDYNCLVYDLRNGCHRQLDIPRKRGYLPNIGDIIRVTFSLQKPDVIIEVKKIGGIEYYGSCGNSQNKLYR